MAATPSLTDEEIMLVSDARFFPLKARISGKIRVMLEATHETLREELTLGRFVTPVGFDAGLFQFVKGEHLESFPYQYLDCPKHFQGGEKWTFRTLFWWGHHLVFAWLLEGRLVKQYKRNIVDRFHALAGHGLELSLAPTLWEWKCGEGYTLPLTHDRKAQIAAILAERSFLKVARFFPLDDPNLRRGELASLARETFRAMRPIVAA